MVMCLTEKYSSHNSYQTETQKPLCIFADKKNSHLYWKALIYKAQGETDKALRIAQHINQNTLSGDEIFLQEKSEDSINSFFDKLFLDILAHDPQTLTKLGLFESIGIKEHNKLLNDMSPEMLLRTIEKAKENIRCLKKYSLENLSDDQKVSYKIFDWILKHTIAGEKFLFHEYKINQMFGAIIEIVSVFTKYHALQTNEDAENYVIRLEKIPQQIDQLIQLIKLQENNGIIAPRFTIEKVINTIKKLTPECEKKNIFYTHLKNEIEKIDSYNKNILLEKALYVIKNNIYPAFKILQEYFTQLLTKTEQNDGVWALPDGNTYYSYLLKHHTTTDLSADEIHTIGLEEVAKIHQEIRTILIAEAINDSKKEIGCLMQEISQNPQLYYQNNDKERGQCLADYKAIIERARKELGHLFNIKPRADVTVQQVPPHEEEGGPGAYYCSPSIDGSRPGIFFANLRNMREEPKYMMESLTIHESEPGHHFQLALQNEMNDLPLVRKIMSHIETSPCTGYIEGWALYTEKLAYEYNFYSSSLSKLGYLKYELLRSARLVIDTGIHYKRWTREQAIEYMKKTTGFHHDMVVTEIERYFVMPGQACAYKIGQLKILELRKKSQETLGEKFKIQEFHDVILKTGSVPLEILEEVIINYIQKKLIN